MISKELQKYNTDIAAPSDVKFAESDTIRKETGYTFNWSKKTLTDRSESGVAFAVSNSPRITKQYECHAVQHAIFKFLEKWIVSWCCFPHQQCSINSHLVHSRQIQKHKVHAQNWLFKIVTIYPLHHVCLCLLEYKGIF